MLITGERPGLIDSFNDVRTRGEVAQLLRNVLAIPMQHACAGGTVKPDIPVGTGKLVLRCDATHRDHPCDAPPYDLDIGADVVDDCRMQGGKLTVQLRSSNDPQDAVTIEHDGVNGPGTFQLDDPYKRYVRVSGPGSSPTCVNDTLTGPPTRGVRVVTGPGMNCESPACTLDVTTADPDAPLPKQFDIRVRCQSLCESNSTLVCLPPTDFTVQATCR